MKFPKSERLCLKKEIEELFAPGNASAATDYPVRMIYRYVTRDDEQAPRTKVLISVAKKRLHHAVDRARAKRQLREAYRLNKPTTSKAANIALVWLADKPQESCLVHEKVAKLLGKI